MNEELYAYVKYRNHGIYIENGAHKYYALIYFNGTCIKNFEGYNGEKLIDLCKERIDSDLQK